MSPVLFNLYINDLLNRVDPVPVRGLSSGLRGLMYADDTVIVGDSMYDITEKLEVAACWMRENGMEINANKCGLMLVRDADDTTYITNQLVHNGELIPNVERYVYLGIEFNNLLNYDWMSQYRLGKASSLVALLTPTLSNCHLPLEYKLMLIKSVIIPTMLFGSEVFGMSQRRLSAMTKILDRSIVCILRRHNFDRRRADEEFDLKAPHMSAAMSRFRGYYKWMCNRSLISDLIKSHADFKSRKRTWAKNSRVWLRTQQLEDLSVVDAYHKLRGADRGRWLARGRSRIGMLSSQWQVGSGKSIRAAEIDTQSSSAGVHSLTLIRTGTFMFTNRLVVSGIVGSHYKSRCVACKAVLIEDAWHFIAECSAFDDLRHRHMPKSIERINRVDSSTTRDRLLGILLGGEWSVARRQQCLLVLEVIEYLGKACVKRSQLVREVSVCV